MSASGSEEPLERSGFSGRERGRADWIYETLNVQRFKIRDEILFPSTVETDTLETSADEQPLS